MKSLIRMTFVTVFGIALLCAVSVSRVEAVLILTLEDIATVSVADASAGDLNPVDGMVTVVLTTDSFLSNVSSGASYDAVGASDYPILDLNSLNVANTSSDVSTITLVLTQTDFGTDESIDGFYTGVAGTITGSGSITFEYYYDEGNDYDWTNATLIGSFTTDDSTFSWSDNWDGEGVLPDDSYSLTIVADLTLAPGSMTSFDAVIEPVPEPATIALLGIGLVGLVGAGIRKQRNNNKKS